MLGSSATGAASNLYPMLMPSDVWSGNFIEIHARVVQVEIGEKTDLRTGRPVALMEPYTVRHFIGNEVRRLRRTLELTGKTRRSYGNFGCDAFEN